MTDLETGPSTAEKKQRFAVGLKRRLVLKHAIRKMHAAGCVIQRYWRCGRRKERLEREEGGGG